MLTDAEPLGNLNYRISALRDLGHRITLELIAEIGLPHHRLLSSKLGSKASRNLGATHTLSLRNGFQAISKLTPAQIRSNLKYFSNRSWRTGRSITKNHISII